MSQADADRWNARYASLGEENVPVPPPDPWLAEVSSGWPPGRALDLACGLGHNSLWLARQGWQVDAVDISPVALDVAARRAGPTPATIHWIPADLETCELAAGVYDLVLVFRYLDRVRFPAWIPRLLKPGGWLVYETFTAGTSQVASSRPRNPAFRLQPGELEGLFPALRVEIFREPEGIDPPIARLLARRAPESPEFRGQAARP